MSEIVAIICVFFMFAGIVQHKDCNDRGGVLIQWQCIKVEKV